MASTTEAHRYDEANVNGNAFIDLSDMATSLEPRGYDDIDINDNSFIRRGNLSWNLGPHRYEDNRIAYDASIHMGNGSTNLEAFSYGRIRGSDSAPVNWDNISNYSETLDQVNTHPFLNINDNNLRIPSDPDIPGDVASEVEKFAENIKISYPTLENYLLQRIAYDRARRYVRLVENKVDRSQACDNGKCPSGDLCSSRVGGPETRRPKARSHVANDDQDSEVVVSASMFPDNVPLPPVSKLPAEFECPLCFQVKRFYKPPDWTKHVYADVQPYTCTFESCTEPRSFKCRADWVRHEEECHRHLEWWECNIDECQHRCYRKDNFVQHLVREHKRKEPKSRRQSARRSRSKSGSNRKRLLDPDDTAFWVIVDECRHETSRKAEDEPCKFCGITASSWKELSAHVGKHMEVISMPTLILAQSAKVTENIIFTPLEYPPLFDTGVYPDWPTTIDMGSRRQDPASLNMTLQDGGNDPHDRNALHGIIVPESWKPPFIATPDDRTLLADTEYASLSAEIVPESASDDKHKCPYCSTELTRPHNLKSHLLTHSQDKPYVCSTCNSRFRRLHDLERHTKLHTGERRHACLKCNRKFTRGDALARHIKEPGEFPGGRAKIDKSYSDHESSNITMNHSADTFVDTSQREDWVQIFTKSLLRDLNRPSDASLFAANTGDEMESLLADFASRIDNNNPSSEIFQAINSIYKSRSYIAQTFLAIRHELSDWNSGGKKEEEKVVISEKPALSQIMQMWFDKDDEHGDLSDNHVEDHAQEPLDPIEDDSVFHTSLITNTEAYSWLLESLRKRLSLTSGGDTINQIRAEVKKHISKPAQLSSPSELVLSEAHFEVSCPIELVEAVGTEVWLDSLLTITGSAREAQAMTCDQYIKQTWPVSGTTLWQLIKDATLKAGNRVSNEENKLQAQLRGTVLSVSALGTRGVLVEIAEQLCWISAALSDPSPDLVAITCIPSLMFVDRRLGGHDLASNEKTEVVYFRVEISYQPCAGSRQAGMCWMQLFRHHTIIKGYPIRRRSKPNLGLEVAIDLAARLMGTERLQQFGGHLFFKRFSALLAPTALDEDTVTWHLCRSQEGSRMSYLDHGLTSLCDIGFHEILKKRHVIGWCANVKHYSGHADTEYMLKDVNLERSRSDDSLFGCALSFGRIVTQREEIRFPSHTQPMFPAVTGYLEKYEFLEQKHVLFWDIGARKGFALHLLRQSFALDAKKDRKGKLFVLKADDLEEPTAPCDSDAAREFLSDPHNLAARVAIANVKRAGELDFEILSERSDRIFGVLEQAFDYQARPQNWTGIARRRLEGWDCSSIAQRQNTIPSSGLDMTARGRNWIDFVRGNNIVTLLGSGFGELLRPGTNACEPFPDNCYSIAISVADLTRIIGVKGRTRNQRLQVVCDVPRTIWYRPPGTLHNCGCNDSVSQASSKSKRLQIMWPSAHVDMLPPEDSDTSLDHFMNGAVVFGHDDSFGYYMPDFGLVPLSLPVIEEDKFDANMTDSGIGTSINSNEITRMPTTSPLSSLPDLNVSRSQESDRRRTYGYTNVNGGYSVLGDMYVSHTHYHPRSPGPTVDSGLGRASHPIGADRHKSTYQPNQEMIWQQWSHPICPRAESDLELRIAQEEIDELNTEVGNLCTVFRV